MKTSNIIAFIESQRVLHKVHKATLCSHASISTTYYNKLLGGAANPSLAVVEALLGFFGYKLGVIVCN